MQDSNLQSDMLGLDRQFECPICLSCLKEPVLTSCGHRFCSSCLNLWLESKGESCPVDGGTLNKKLDLFPDHFTRREILNRTTICKLCKLEIGLSEMDEHVSSHHHSRRTKKIISEDNGKGCCPFGTFGCDVDVTENTLKDHLEKDLNLHLNLVANSHLNLREKLLKNTDKMSDDVLAQESLMWEPQEKGKDRQNASLMRALYERVVVLEQRCHEQNAQMEKLKGRLEESNDRIREVSLRHACGQYLWRIDDFGKKIGSMKSGDKRVFFSEGFYTSPNGYKICGRINLSPVDSDMLSLLIHIMQTPHDHTLVWPFTGRIQFAIVHPTDSKLTIAETIMSRPDLDSFKKPARDINTKAFGYPQFISINKIFNNGYLIDDSLIVKLHVQEV